MSKEEITQIVHAVVLDYGCGDDENFQVCFICDTKEQAMKEAREMGGDHKYRELEVQEEIND